MLRDEFLRMVGSINELRKIAPAFEIANWNSRYDLAVSGQVLNEKNQGITESFYFHSISPLEVYDLVRCIWSLFTVQIGSGEVCITIGKASVIGGAPAKPGIGGL